jgi:hypothetical protein
MMACFIIGATLRSGWNARHEAQTASPFPSQAAASSAVETHATHVFEHKRGPRLAIQGHRPRGAFAMQIGRKRIFVFVLATPVLSGHAIHSTMNVGLKIPSSFSRRPAESALGIAHVP